MKQQGKYFEIVVENIQEGWRLDKCRIVSQCSDLSIDRIKEIFGIQNQSQFDDLVNYVHQKFESEQINWKLVNGNLFRRNSKKTCLSPDLIIKDMVELVQVNENLI